MSHFNFLRILLVVVAGSFLLFGCANGEASGSFDLGGGPDSGVVGPDDAGSNGGGDVSDPASDGGGNDASGDAGNNEDTGAQDSGADAPIALHAVGGTVSGLSGTGLVLQDNGGDNLPLSSSGLFAFPQKIASGSPYEVTVLTQPTGPTQSCVVADGSGTVGSAGVTNVTITCTTTTFTVGGTITGLATGDAGTGSALVLEDNGGDELTVSANGTFAFPTSVASGAGYAVTVKTQPTAPAQACTVSGGVGTVDTGNVSSVVVNCAIDTFTVGGTISGLAGLVILQDNGGDNAALDANGNFAFATPLPSGTPYVVTVLTQPGAPSQTCAVTNGTGDVASANVTSISVTCTTNTFTVGGTLSGLATGDSVVLQDDGGDNLTLPTNGTFTFATPVTSGGAYSVTVLTQPGAPAQSCVVSGGSGIIGALNVTSVAVTCSTNQFTVGGALRGLAAGNSVVLQDNGGDSLTLSADGSFTFATPVPSGAAFAVTVSSQPGAPAQTCTVGGGTGTIGASNVTSVSVNCGTNVYAVGGTISGLSGTVVLRDNEGDSLTLSSNGSFAFATALASGTAYAVTVETQPPSPVQNCVITQGSGTVTNAPVTSVNVACTTLAFTIGGTVTGLAVNESVVLEDNGGDNLTVTARGTFTFPTPVSSGQPYIVTVVTNPASPIAQTCSVSAASGNVAAAAITTVLVSCTTNAYAVGATVVGLAANDTVVLQDSAGDTLSITGNGTYTFPTAVSSGVGYAVTVSSQPGSPIVQTCAVTSGSGTVTNAPIAVTVTCSTTSFTVGGTLAGLGAQDSVVLQDNLGDNLAVGANGAFTFATPVPSGGGYAVSVLTDPTSPIAQQCTVSAAQGTVGNGNVTSVLVNCSTSSFAVGGTITGLMGSVVLEDNGGDNLTLASNGAFAFATPIASGSTYAVTVLTNPSSPVQTCVVAQGAGTIVGAAASVVVTCTTSTFAVGGSLGGLAPGESLSLLDNGGSTLTLTANGSFSFATAVQSGATYAVTVSSQPPGQTCVVANGGGTVSSGAITTVNVTCTGFGATCPAGTVYTESWVSNPFASGRWTNIVGSETYNVTSIPLSESLLSVNTTTQMWIGARPSWTNYTVSVPVRMDTGTSADNAGINFRMESVGTANDSGQMYFAGISTNQVLLGVQNNGNWTQYASNSGTYNLGTFYTLQVVVSGSTIAVSVNGGNTLSYTSTTFATGSFGLRAYNLGMTYGPITVTCD